MYTWWVWQLQMIQVNYGLVFTTTLSILEGGVELVGRVVQVRTLTWLNAGNSLEIRLCFRKSRIWLVGQWPHDDGGVVLVPSNHLLHYLQMVSQSDVVEVLSTAAPSRWENRVHTVCTYIRTYVCSRAVEYIFCSVVHKNVHTRSARIKAPLEATPVYNQKEYSTKI